MADLKLLALDAEDLAVLSAHVQDAVLKVEDMTYLPRERRFVALVNRFDWAETHGRRRFMKVDHRRRAALRLERVTAAKLLGIDLKAKSRVLSILALTFTPGSSPAGIVEIVLAGGAGIRLEVDCIEAQLSDLGPAWSARARPDHGREGDGGPGGDTAT